MGAYAGTANPAANGQNGRVPPMPSQPPAAPADAVPSQRGSLTSLIQHLETVTFETPAEVAEFCEAVRALGHRIAVECHLGGTELHESLKAEAKNKGKLNIPNFDMLRAGKKVVRKLNSAAAHFQDGAGEAVAAWKTFEKEFEPLMDGGKKPQTRKGFRFDG
jgi:hypothetical protein